MKKRKALAEALEEESLTAQQKSVEDHLVLMREHLTVHFIEADRICPAPLESKPQEEDLTGLCDSIRRFGLLQPLTVRRVCSDNASLGGVYTLVSGGRRLAALKALGIKKAPCIISDIPASSAAAAAMSASLHRSKDSVFETADKLAELCKSTGIAGDSLAKRLSISKERLEALKALTIFDERERRLIERFDFPEPLILALSRITDAAQRRRCVAECGACISGLVSSLPTKERGSHQIFNDLLPFYNSIDRLTAQIRASGFAANCTKVEEPLEYVVTVRVPKYSVKALRLTKKPDKD